MSTMNPLDPYGGSTPPIEQMLGNAYDNVRKVAQNINVIKAVDANKENIDKAAQISDDVMTMKEEMEVAVSTSQTAATSATSSANVARASELSASQSANTATSLVGSVKKAILCYDTFTEAQAAAATLPDGQEVECPDGNGVLSRFKVEESALLFQRLAGNAKSTSFIQNGHGAIGRTVEDKLREFPSIGDYASFADYVNASVSSNWYAEYGGKIRRFTDRVLMGDAAKVNGRNESVQADWLTAFQLATGRSNGFLQSAQGAILQGAAPDASNAFVVGAQTSTLYDNYNAVGLIGIAVSNKASGSGFAYGAYLEGFRMPGTTGGAYGIEVDTVNYATLTGIDPYFQDAGQTIGVQIASGAELSSVGQFDSTAAINIQNNGTKFFKGLVFGHDALTGSDGVTGLAEAITFAKGHTIQWWGAQGVQTSSIYCEGTTTAGGLGMRFSENQLQLRAGGAGKIVYQMFAPAGSVNYLSNRSSATGNAVQVLAQGDDTNIDLQLVPKGAGLIVLGAWSSNADSPVNGYISIRDSAGNVRKLATIA